VVFFHGCFLNFNRPDIGREIRDTLASLGVEVAVPNQVCCGLPALGGGDFEKAKSFAMKNAGILVHYINRGYDVVYSCTSCGLTLIRDYPGILDIPEGKRISENTYSVHEYILKLMDEGYVTPEFGEMKMKVAYHVPCHLRALGIGYPAVRLFERIPGLTFKVFEDHCCGLSGTYGFKAKNKEVSIKLGTLAAAPIRAYAPDVVVSDCAACRMQLEHFTGIEMKDPSEIIIESLKKAGYGTRGISFMRRRA
jgi:glycerol-3-phosphate dehydrogenase subunit C